MWEMFKLKALVLGGIAILSDKIGVISKIVATVIGLSGFLTVGLKVKVFPYIGWKVKVELFMELIWG